MTLSHSPIYKENLSTLSFLLKIAEYINMNMTFKIVQQALSTVFCLALLNTLDISCENM